MKRSTLIHTIAYMLVAASSFWGGALTRDYLVVREVRLARERPNRFINQPAPPVESSTVDGAHWSLAELRGKVVVIEGWATWCGPCISHLPASKKIYEQFNGHPDFVYIGASLDGQVEKVKQFIAKHEVPWTILVEPGREFDSAVAEAFQIHRIPFTCVIDKQGIIRRYDERSTKEFGGTTKDLIERLLAANPSPVPPTNR